MYSNIYPTRCNVTQFILSGNCSTCFGWYHHPSSGVQTTLCTASGICHTVTATCRYRGRVGTGLSVLWLAYATRSTLKPAGGSNGVTNIRCCKYSCLHSWWWVVVPPETCRAVSRYNKLCNVASCWIYIKIFLQCTDPWTLHNKRILARNSRVTRYIFIAGKTGRLVSRLRGYHPVAPRP